MSKANERQEGGNHYKRGGEEHWDRMVRILGLDQARGYFIASSTKYIERYQWKNGIEDLKKARHFVEKLIELEEAELQKCGKVDNSSPDYKDGIKATSSPEDTTKSTTHIFLSGELNKVDSSRNKLKVNLPGDNDLVQNGHGWAEPPDPI